MKRNDNEKTNREFRTGHKHCFGVIAAKATACVLGTAILLESSAIPVNVHAADSRDTATVTIQAEELEALANEGNYLIPATDGIESAPIEAVLTTEFSPAGGFQPAKSPVITKKRAKLFRKAFKKFVGSEITPVAY
ncbi:MAG: hypothetical protein K6E62_06590 [Lachnospiraceae bacterium]|nr:hypothetical protein [Lachnospiraceae bacterium]